VLTQTVNFGGVRWPRLGLFRESADRSIAVADAIRRPILAKDWQFLGFDEAQKAETVDSW
jgi:hypothetical protein